jgi:hypothetical protein
VGDTAAVVDTLLAPVVAGRADMAVGVLPPAGRRGGLGRVRALAAAGIRQACGFDARAPLSGQRAVRGELLRSLLPLPDRFGLAVGLTIDAVRAGARVVEVDVPMEHRHTGRTVLGFRHRGRQGLDVVRALWPRLTTAGQRVAAIALLFVVLAGAALWQGTRWEPGSVPPSARPSRVVLFGMPGVELDDLGTGTMPTLDRLRAQGAVAAVFVRTLGKRPSVPDGYASLGAGTRVVAGDNRGRHVSSEPGALGEALARAGKRVAVVGPTAATWAFPEAPVVDDVGAALSTADVVLVDPGVTDPAWVDAALAEVARSLGPDTLLLALSPASVGDDWHLTPMVASGPGVRAGYLHSVSTRREGLVSLADLAPTVLDALGVPRAEGMVGRALRYRTGEGAGGLSLLRDMDRDASFRERWYLPTTTWYVTVQALAYGFAVVAFSRLGGRRRWGPVLRWLVLAVSAWPLTTFLWRAIPDVAELGDGAILLALGIDAAVVFLALRARRRPLSPLAWICGATVALILFDVWTGARLQASSQLGYSLQTAGRFTGLGNTTFAVLAATTVLVVCLHVHHAPRRREALATGVGVCGLVVLTDGAPSLGSDVGGILSLIPVFGLLLVALSGRRLSPKVVALTALAAVAALVGAAVFDYLRPATSRTHLGRLVADMRADGLAPFLVTVRRKVAGNLRTISSPWTWAVPVVTAYLLWMLVWARGLQRLLPRGSAVRAAAVGVLGIGVLGNVVNDSGMVVTAVVFVYLGPLLTLRALDAEVAAT